MAHKAGLVIPQALDFDFGSIDWIQYQADPRFDYPIDYAIGFLGVVPETKTVDFVGRWAPNSYCHFHRHLADTTSLILAGEHHTIETINGEAYSAHHAVKVIRAAVADYTDHFGA